MFRFILYEKINKGSEWAQISSSLSSLRLRLSLSALILPLRTLGSSPLSSGILQSRPAKSGQLRQALSVVAQLLKIDFFLISYFEILKSVSDRIRNGYGRGSIIAYGSLQYQSIPVWPMVRARSERWYG